MDTYKFVTNYDDWEGLYDVDGLLIDEGHTLNLIELFNKGYINSIKSYHIETIEIVGDWLAVEGSLPATYKEFKEKERQCG